VSQRIIMTVEWYSTLSV